jgi:hypothetical protein
MHGRCPACGESLVQHRGFFVTYSERPDEAGHGGLSGGAATAVGVKSSAVRAGHLRAVAQLEAVDAVHDTLALYRAVMRSRHGVYLRPTHQGFTVLSLDHERCSAMVAVGAVGTTHHNLTRLPAQSAFVERAVRGYETKIAGMGRASPEERYSLNLVSGALSAGLILEGLGVHFVSQEWRFPVGGRMDILGVDLAQRRLVVVELKASARHAAKVDARKGGDATQQAEAYAELLFRERAVLYPFFERLARAMARIYQGPEAMKQLRLDMTLGPSVLVAAP